MFRYVQFLLILISFISHSVFAVSASTDSTILDVFLKDLHTLQADFTQQVLDDKNNVLENTSGVLYLQRPNQFYWHYQKPYEQLIVADGHSIWIYDTDLDQVTIKGFDASMDSSPAMILSGTKNLANIFNIEKKASDIVNQESLILSPKSTQAQFQQLQLLFIDKVLKVLRFEDNLGHTTLINLNNIRRNPILKAGLFQFEPPAHVDVIDGRK